MNMKDIIRNSVLSGAIISTAVRSSAVARCMPDVPTVQLDSSSVQKSHACDESVAAYP